MHVAVTVAAVVILIAAAGVLKWLPARATDEMVFPPAEDRDDAVADHDVIAVASD
jgi:hypothetical protein